MSAAAQNPHTDVLGHRTGRLIEGARGTRLPSSFAVEEVLTACAERAERCGGRLARRAVEQGGRPREIPARVAPGGTQPAAG
ncbi:MAG: hypothetical protein ACK5IN_01530 [Microbacterium sp.]